MDHSEKFEEDGEKMKTEVHELEDTIYNKLGEKNPDRFNKALADTVVAHCEDNQECAPSPPEQHQEPRNRVCSKVQPGQEPGPEQKSDPEESNNGSPEVQKPGESDCKPVQSLFQDMLKRLEKLFQDVLECVQDCTSLVKKMKTIWSDIEKLYSSVAKCFSILCQA